MRSLLFCQPYHANKRVEAAPLRSVPDHPGLRWQSAAATLLWIIDGLPELQAIQSGVALTLPTAVQVGLVAAPESPLVLRMIVRMLLPLMLVSSVVAGEIPEKLRKEFKLSPFYTQCLMVGDFPIVASAKVNPAALEEAKVIIGSMLSQRKDIVAALAKAPIRLRVMATSERTCDIPEHSDLKPAAFWNRRARGLGATIERPSVSCAGKLMKAYDDAIAVGKWKGKYAASNGYEYWGEAVQSWFGTNRENDNEHNHVNTRPELIEYDPEVAKLCAEVFGKGVWQYVRADDPKRQTEPHLKNLDRSKLPVFEWSAEERKPMPEPKDQ